MTDLVVSGDISVWLTTGNGVDNRVNLSLGVIGKENWANIGALDVSETGSVLFLLLTGQLVLLDNVVLIFLDGGSPYNAVLLKISHVERINIEGWIWVLDKPSVRNKLLKVGASEIIHLVRVRIGLWWEFDLWLIDAEE
jgi:hypothetical protein